MTISELIERLEELKEQHGDVEADFESDICYGYLAEVDEVFYLKDENIVVIR